MSDSELYDKAFVGLKVAEREIVEGVAEKCGVSSALWKTILGNWLSHQVTIELRVLIGQYLKDDPEYNPLRNMLTPYGRTIDVEDLVLFVDQELAQDDTAAVKGKPKA